MTGRAWRIENDEKVRIQGERWIEDTIRVMPQTFNDRVSRIEFVSNLIETDLMSWKEYIVRQCFDKKKADQICAIPLSRRRPEDGVIWGVGLKRSLHC